MEPALLHGSCLDILPTVPSDSFDCAITSPPYNMNLRIRGGRHCSRQIVKELSTKYEGYSDNLPMSEYYEMNRRVISELLRISKTVFYNVQFLTGNKSALYRLMGEFSENIKEFIVWDKLNAEPAIGSGVLNSRWEAILVLQGRTGAISRRFDNHNFGRGELQNLWQIKRGGKVAGSHGAVFPVELAEKIICNFVPVGGSVIDPFMGTGTTGVACKKFGARFTGIELSEKYMDIAKKRISETPHTPAHGCTRSRPVVASEK